MTLVRVGQDVLVRGRRTHEAISESCIEEERQPQARSQGTAVYHCFAPIARRPHPAIFEPVRLGHVPCTTLHCTAYFCKFVRVICRVIPAENQG